MTTERPARWLTREELDDAALPTAMRKVVGRELFVFHRKMQMLKRLPQNADFNRTTQGLRMFCVLLKGASSFLKSFFLTFRILCVLI